MIPASIIFSNIKQIGYILLVVAVIWFYKDWQFQRAENTRQTENARQLRMSDSLKFTSQILTSKEMQDYLMYQNSDLQKKLKENNIKTSRIDNITSNNYYYKDTIERSTDASKMVNSIRAGVPDEQNFIDTTNCMTIKGKLVYNGQNLSININNREFKNKTDAVVYWQRRQWNFLGIKTRFLGKKEFTSKIFDNCGESKIVKIEKKK